MDLSEKTPLKSLSECIGTLRNHGFEQNFTVEEPGLCVAGSGRYYKPEEVKITNFYRFEGESDPGDSSILYAIETKDGVRGTLSDSYGPYADPAVAEFIIEVQEIEKRQHASEKPTEAPQPKTDLW